QRRATDRTQVDTDGLVHKRTECRGNAGRSHQFGTMTLAVCHAERVDGETTLARDGQGDCRVHAARYKHDGRLAPFSAHGFLHHSLPMSISKTDAARQSVSHAHRARTHTDRHCGSVNLARSMQFAARTKRGKASAPAHRPRATCATASESAPAGDRRGSSR